MRDGTITLMSTVWMCECVSPVVRSLWQRTDAALLLRTHNQTPCCLSRLWRWRRSCSPRAHVQSPGIRGPLFYQPANRKSNKCDVTVTGGRRQNSPPISHRWSWCPTRKCWSRSSVCVCLGTEQLRPYPGGRSTIHSLMMYLYILCYSKSVYKYVYWKIFMFYYSCKASRAHSEAPRCTLSFIMESWHILSPLASGTSSTPISLALYLTPSPWNLPTRYSSVFSVTVKATKPAFLKSLQSILELTATIAFSVAHLSSSLSWTGPWMWRGKWEGCWRLWSGTRRWDRQEGRARCSPPLRTWCGVSLGWTARGRGAGRKADGSSVFRGQRGQPNRWLLTPTHAFLVVCLEEEEGEAVTVHAGGEREKKEKKKRKGEGDGMLIHIISWWNC